MTSTSGNHKALTAVPSTGDDDKASRAIPSTGGDDKRRHSTNKEGQVPESADPLGKRALFVPASGPGVPRRQPAPGVGSGKRALYSGHAGDPHPEQAIDPEPADAAQATSPLQHLADEAAQSPARPSVGGILGQVHLHCETCDARSQVDVVQSLLLRLPLPVVRPGRGFTHLMTCPACGKRTWMSASWHLLSA